MPESEEIPGHGGSDGGEESEELTPVDTNVKITLTDALDNHESAISILEDRLKSISSNPSKETVIIVGHGPDSEDGRIMWPAKFKSICNSIKSDLGFKDVRYSFVAMGSPSVQDVLSELSSESKENIIVMPLMISEGSFTDNVLPALLKDYEYKYPEKGQRSLLPHDKIAEFIETKINGSSSPVNQPKIINTLTSWSPKYNVRSDMAWDVDFDSSSTTIEEMGSKVYITHGNEIVDVSYEKIDDNKIKLVPVQNYSNGETYTLWIKTTVTTSKKIVRKTTKMDFTIQNSQQ